ncbi:MAG: hypothetical protein ACFFDH_23015 [Promethearchaeota archaeon]
MEEKKIRKSQMEQMIRLNGQFENSLSPKMFFNFPIFGTQGAISFFTKKIYKWGKNKVIYLKNLIFSNGEGVHMVRIGELNQWVYDLSIYFYHSFISDHGSDGFCDMNVCMDKFKIIKPEYEDSSLIYQIYQKYQDFNRVENFLLKNRFKKSQRVEKSLRSFIIIWYSGHINFIRFYTFHNFYNFFKDNLGFSGVLYDGCC